MTKCGLADLSWAFSLNFCQTPDIDAMWFPPCLIPGALVQRLGVFLARPVGDHPRCVKCPLPTPLMDCSLRSLQKRSIKQVHVSEQKPPGVTSPLPRPPYLVTKSHRFYLPNWSSASCLDSSLVPLPRIVLRRIAEHGWPLLQILPC